MQARHHFVSILLWIVTYWSNVSRGYDLTILHTNDVHARFEQHSVNGGTCKADDAAKGKCYGGTARRMTKVTEVRNSEPNTIFLDGGDQFQGTMWFFQYRGDATAHFMNLLGYDAMALGNHEFDNEVSGLIPFLKEANFSVISCNIDASEVPEMANLFTKSVVKVIGGQEIGIVGYTTTETPLISSPAPLKFFDEVTSVQVEVNKLIDRGVNKIIAVGHSGFAVDQDIAKRVEGVDIVVGGHTNTFLYSGDPPSIEKPEGPYPTVVTHDTGDKVLVVQDYTFGKYLGHLRVTFDDQGKLTSWDGNPILLDASVAEDNQTLVEIEKWAGAVRNVSSRVIGRSNVYINGERPVCRTRECSMGNLYADAFIHQNLKHTDGLQWNRVAIALMNSGGIRASIERGPVTVGDVLVMAPFGNVVNIIEITGQTLWDALEHAVAEYKLTQPSGKFLQVSGLKVVYNLEKSPNKRVVSVQALCTDCLEPKFEPLNTTKVYMVVLNEFISGGGDGYSMIRDNIIRKHYQGDVDSDLVMEYIKAVSPVYPRTEGRITFVTEGPRCTSNAYKRTFSFVKLISAMIILFGFIS